MTTLVADFLNLIAHHLTAAGFGGGAFLIAVICTMPPEPPGFLRHICSQAMWTWIREALQTVVPAARHPQNPSAPAAPASK